MSKKILVIPTEFKESIKAKDVSGIIKKKLFSLLPENKFKIVSFPLSDGGDGFLDAISSVKKTEVLNFPISSHFSIDEFINVQVLYEKNESVVYIESARVIGLKITPIEKRNPLLLNTFALGELIKLLDKKNKSGEMKIKKVVIGLGGTATQDLGLGAASAFGLRILRCSRPLPVYPKFFEYARKISYSHFFFDLSFIIEAIVDVQNPLLGEKGTNNVFAKQKGASEREVILLEKGFNNILRLLKVNKNQSLNGAAGGLSFGLEYFFGAKIIPAKSFIEENFLKINSDADFVITGEGKLDSQTLVGKAPSVIYNFFRPTGIPVFLITGKNELLNNEIDNVYEISVFYNSEVESIQNPVNGIEKAVEEITKKILENI